MPCCASTAPWARAAGAIAIQNRAVSSAFRPVIRVSYLAALLGAMAGEWMLEHLRANDEAADCRPHGNTTRLSTAGPGPEILATRQWTQACVIRDKSMQLSVGTDEERAALLIAAADALLNGQNPAIPHGFVSDLFGRAAPEDVVRYDGRE